MHALVVADGDAPSRADLDRSWPGWAVAIDLVIAADGGAAACPGLAIAPDLVVGDLDSIDPSTLERLASAGVGMDRSPRDKDESDTELAILAAVGRGADRVTVVGAFGGPRLDHELANVALLALPALRTVDACLLDARARVRLLQAPDPDGRPVVLQLPGPVGAVVSLLPAGDDVEGVTTSGLRFELHDEALAFGWTRGLSNVRSDPSAFVRVRRGRLLVVESPATLAP